MATYFQNVQNINITGRISKSEFQYTLQSSDTETLYRVGPEMLEKISKLPGLRDVTGDLYIKNPQMTMEIDREAAAVYGVSLDQVRQELYNCFGARQVGTIYTASNDYQVILECDKKIQDDPTGLSKVYLKTNLNGQATGGGIVAPAAGSGVNGSTSPTGPVDPAVRGNQAGADRRRAAGQSPGPAALDDDFVQSGPRLRRSAPPSTPSGRSSRRRTCRPRSSPASRARRRCSRIL